MKRKMERVMKQHSENEAAYLKMRQCAGNMDVKDMVSKFLSREQTYQSLLKQISGLEAKFEKSRDFEEEQHKQLQALRIEYENKKGLNQVDERQQDR